MPGTEADENETDTKSGDVHTTIDAYAAARINFQDASTHVLGPSGAGVQDDPIALLELYILVCDINDTRSFHVSPDLSTPVCPSRHGLR